MVGKVILCALVSAGVVLAVLGFLAIRGKRQPRAVFFERMLLEVLSLKTERQTAQVLGRLRMVYGIFLIVVALWGLRA